MEKISVVIPAYNHDAFISEAIESVLGLDYKVQEIIVIDDGSTDNTKKVACKYKKVDYYFKDNAGAHSAINTGIEIASGNYIAILNDDDIYYKNHISVAISNLKTYGNGLFIGHNSLIGEGRKLYQLKHQMLWSKLDIENWGLTGSLFRNNWSLSTSSFVFEKRLAIDVNGFQNFILCHDLDFLLRIIFETGISVGTSEETTWAYRCHSGNSNSFIEQAIQIAEILYVLGRTYYQFNAEYLSSDFVNLVGYGIDSNCVVKLLEDRPWILRDGQSVSESIIEWKENFKEWYTNF